MNLKPLAFKIFKTYSLFTSGTQNICLRSILIRICEDILAQGFILIEKKSPDYFKICMSGYTNKIIY